MVIQKARVLRFKKKKEFNNIFVFLEENTCNTYKIHTSFKYFAKRVLKFVHMYFRQVSEVETGTVHYSWLTSRGRHWLNFVNEKGTSWVSFIIFHFSYFTRAAILRGTASFFPPFSFFLLFYCYFTVIFIRFSTSCPRVTAWARDRLSSDQPPLTDLCLGSSCGAPVPQAGAAMLVCVFGGWWKFREVKAPSTGSHFSSCPPAPHPLFFLPNQRHDGFFLPSDDHHDRFLTASISDPRAAFDGTRIEPLDGGSEDEGGGSVPTGISGIYFDSKRSGGETNSSEERGFEKVKNKKRKKRNVRRRRRRTGRAGAQLLLSDLSSNKRLNPVVQPAVLLCSFNHL